ncbi:MAG: FAD-dependent oxidoreductase [Chloroflexi bacterium HGW-Chloroflexi-4]|nr:MAG: FAD-dependent oxidoreductase [Chloroflexi bacterium HGW-Chloroflexi-4]
MDRISIIEVIKKNPVIDVLIVGAGINGAGTFRDLALNGVNVLLIDRGDFCSGTSATSSHMAHGGIRYLENGEFRLVEEAVAERNRMIENAPHLVQPLPTVIPIFKVWSGLLNAPLKFVNLLDRPSERGALVIKIGLIFYDSFTRKQKTVPRHKFFGKSVALSRYPFLNENIKYAALYYDGHLLSPERMTVEIILDGEDEGEHAKALNYASFNKIEDGKVLIKDEETGELLSVKPKMIINAAGPWIDYVNQNAGVKTKYIGGTKGSHLVIKNDELRKAVGESEFFFENKDGRIVLCLPFYDKVIVGTSDLPIDNPDDAHCTPEEEEYFINLVDRVFPTIKITRDQIVFRFSGVRPLEYQHAKTTGQITRDHSVKEDMVQGFPVLSLVGGKWTSFRAFSEQVAAKVMAGLGKIKSKSTESLPIRGGKNLPLTKTQKEAYTKTLVSKYGFSEEYARELLTRYGTCAEKIADQIEKSKGKMIKSIPNWNSGELVYILKNEKPLHLDDLFVRRSTIMWLGNASDEVIEEFADIMADEYKWSMSKKKEEIIKVKNIIANS